MFSQESPGGPVRRLECAACLRPASACVCRFRVELDCRVEVLVLQHPDEVRHAKGSARLLHLCLPGSALEVGECFDPHWLEQQLHRDGRAPVLLYPDPKGTHAADTARLQADALRLVVLDGTWRQSRKLLAANPVLARLPRLDLALPQRAGYHIRKAHRPGQLATMEAAALALQALEPGSRAGTGLLEAFDAFVGAYNADVKRRKQQRAGLEEGGGLA
jgi:DTW domain-containing protein YfiP